MTSETTEQGVACPPEVLRLLPWFSEGALGDDERGRVEAHVAACRACRDEVMAMEGELLEPGVAIPPADRVYARVRERIEGDALALPEAPPVRTISPVRERIFAAAAGFAVAVVAGAVFLAGGDSTEPTYRPATTQEGVAAAAPRVDAIFRPDATAEQIGQALQAIGGVLVDGPAEFGRYRIELRESDADPTLAALVLRGSSAPGGSTEGVDTSGGGRSTMAPGVAIFAEPVHD